MILLFDIAVLFLFWTTWWEFYAHYFRIKTVYILSVCSILEKKHKNIKLGLAFFIQIVQKILIDLVCALLAELVDATDLKSVALYGRASSSLAEGTIQL